MRYLRALSAVVLVTALATFATRASLPTADAATSSAGSVASKDVNRRYGKPVSVGNGRARAYVVTDRRNGDTPLEIGVALDEKALEGLPAVGNGHHDGHSVGHEFILPLPSRHGTQFTFVEMNWNPTGHEPPEIYGVPHFDFHFYVIPKAERDAIVPSDPQWAANAENVPTGDYVPPFTLPLGPPGAPKSALAVPKMGLHWSDVRSPELQGLLGNPEAYEPFTATFIIGSWRGKYHFWEPMITRAHLLEKKTTSDPAVRDQFLPIATAAKYQLAGYYPTQYRITWDPQAKEYRVALTNLTWRE